ncbi:MAG TPA: hypothetical protein VK149_03860 [Sideroxyarcus sp.]|nr:hypothetical protein [Sideroxyarcus sp.]
MPGTTHLLPNTEPTYFIGISVFVISDFLISTIIFGSLRRPRATTSGAASLAA